MSFTSATRKVRCEVSLHAGARIQIVFDTPSVSAVQASIGANTYVVSGQSQERSEFLSSMLGCLCRLADVF